MMFCRLIIVTIVQCLASLALGGVKDVRYLTTCDFVGPQEQHFQHDCHAALFTNKEIAFSGKIITVDHDFCTSMDSNDELISITHSQNLAVLVRRGNCAFSMKALHAQRAGYNLVIIANSEEEGFPVGPPELDFVLNVPVVMVGKNVWDEMYDSNVYNTVRQLEQAPNSSNKDTLSTALKSCYHVTVKFGTLFFTLLFCLL